MSGIHTEALAPYIDQSRQELAITLGHDGAEQFERNNRDTHGHMLRVGAMVGFVLAKEGASEQTARLGMHMGVAHDIGKDGLDTDPNTVWTPERIKQFREEHTSRGLDKVLARWSEVPDPEALRIATEQHHSSLPERYHKLTTETANQYGLLHLIQAADRWDAFIWRPYARQSGAGMSPEEAMDKWVINGRPHPVEPVAIVDGQTVDFRPYLLDLA